MARPRDTSWPRTSCDDPHEICYRWERGGVRCCLVLRSNVICSGEQPGNGPSYLQTRELRRLPQVARGRRRRIWRRGAVATQDGTREAADHGDREMRPSWNWNALLLSRLLSRGRRAAML